MNGPADAGAGPAPARPDDTLAWRDALLAAAAVEAAFGFLAASTVAYAPSPIAFFICCAAAALVADAALVPGWLWAPGPFAPLPLLWRALFAGAALAMAGLVGLGLGFTILLLPLSFPVAGAIAGLGAVAAEFVDWRQGAEAPPRARIFSHVIGGLGGVIAVLGAAGVLGLLHGPDLDRSAWPAALLLGPAALALGGSAHNVLALRDAERAGYRLPPRGLVLRRTVACCTAAVLLGVAVLLTPGLPAAVWATLKG